MAEVGVQDAKAMFFFQPFLVRFGYGATKAGLVGAFARWKPEPDQRADGIMIGKQRPRFAGIDFLKGEAAAILDTIAA
jgi:hypothetical protein